MTILTGIPKSFGIVDEVWCASLSVLIEWALTHWKSVQQTCANWFCQVDLTVDFMVSVKTVCGNYLCLRSLSLVLNRWDNAGFAMCLTALCVVAFILSSACPMDVFHLEAKCSGFKPVLFHVSVDISVLFAAIISRNNLSFRVGSTLLSIASEQLFI